MFVIMTSNLGWLIYSVGVWGGKLVQAVSRKYETPPHAVSTDLLLPSLEIHIEILENPRKGRYQEVQMATVRFSVANLFSVSETRGTKRPVKIHKDFCFVYPEYEGRTFLFAECQPLPHYVTSRPRTTAFFTATAEKIIFPSALLISC
jgi:hypothetical protein